MTKIVRRAVPAIMAAAGLVFAIGAFDLTAWSASGPDSGLFPRAAAIILIASSLCVLFSSDHELSAEKGASAFSEAGAPERSTFIFYILGMIAMAVSVYFAGYILTTIATCLLIVWRAERRSILNALVFSIILAISTSFLFRTVLTAGLPDSSLDESFFLFTRGWSTWIS